MTDNKQRPVDYSTFKDLDHELLKHNCELCHKNSDYLEKCTNCNIQICQFCRTVSTLYMQCKKCSKLESITSINTISKKSKCIVM